MKKKSTRYQNGATFNYDKAGDIALTTQDVSNINKGTGIQFTPEFGQSYFSQQSQPAQQQPQIDYSRQPIIDITSDGQYTNRKVWRTQRPEWFVGKKEPLEGRDYTTVPYKQWGAYQNSPEYSAYTNRGQLAEMQFGGDFQVPQNIGYQPQSMSLVNSAYQPQEYSQNFIQNNPIPNYNNSGFQANPNTPDNPSSVFQTSSNPLAADAGSGYSVDENGNQVENEKTKFFNPYGGFDIPSAAYKLGEGIQTGNAFDIGVSGLKLASGLGRNIASGMGQANRREYVLDEYNKDVRNASRPRANYQQNGGYYQEGGQTMGQQMPPQEQDQGQEIMQQVASALQGGADPQQILEQLITSGIPEEQATALIQGIMQQLQEAPQEGQEMMQRGGTINPEYLQEDDLNNYVAELEKDEFVKKPNGQIQQVIGKKHSQGGVKLTEEQLPEGSQIISDHLKVGKDGAKKFNDDYDLGIKSTDTYATVIDKFNRKSGIKKIVDEQEIVLKNIEKQTKKLEDNPAAEGTINLNIQLFTDQYAELQEQKAPLEEARKMLFDEVFQPQEESKETGHNVEAAQEPIPQPQEQQAMANGGIFNGDMIMKYSKKHNIHPDRVKELMQMHANGGIQRYQNGVTTPYLQNSTLITDFSNSPATLENLPYTPVETNPNEIWQGVNYANVWKPLVETSLSNPDQAKKIDEWLTTNKGNFAPNVQKQLEGLTGEARIEKIKYLATDTKPGLFHNAILSAIKAVAPENIQTAVTPTETKTGYTVSGASGRDKYVLPNLPNQSPLLPDSLQGALLLKDRPNLVEAPIASPAAQITEIRRQEQSAMQGLQNLPDSQKASAIAQIQANTQSALNNAMAQTTGANQQAKYNADVTNARAQTESDRVNAGYLQNYENKILRADATTQANLRNYYNTAQKVNLGNYNYVQGLNLVNDRYNNAQYTGDGTEMANLQRAQDYNTWLAKTPEQKKIEAQAEIDRNKKAAAKSKGRFGGTK